VKCGATSAIAKKLPKVNNRPIGENLPNLATLMAKNGYLKNPSLKF
jgi:hypothetical protein